MEDSGPAGSHHSAPNSRQTDSGDKQRLKKFARLTFVALAWCASIADAAAAAPSLAEETEQLRAWHAERAAGLTRDDGWLTVVGLYWLKEGSNSFGRSRDNAVSLPGTGLAPHAGHFVVTGHSVRFVARAGSGVTVSGRPAGTVELEPGDEAHPVVLESGSVRCFVIERGGRFALRVRDLASRERREFAGLDYFPADPGWVVDARFESYEPARHLTIINVVGMEVDMVSPGALVFEHDGHESRLDALSEDDEQRELFLMFADGTSGHETYGAGRFLYVPWPRDGVVRVDFNKAYNPPCAFTRFATCPLPPPQNRLVLPIRAGELRYSAATH